MATTSELLSLDDVYRARELISGRLHRTPMLTLSFQRSPDVVGGPFDTTSVLDAVSGALGSQLRGAA